MLFRGTIYFHQTDLRAKFVGSIKVNESYFGAKRQRGFHGKLKRLKQMVFGILKAYFDDHLKESEWRWMKGPNELAAELWNLIR